MDPVFQHGSSSGYIHHDLDGPDFLIAEHHLHAVANMLTSTTFQAMDVNPRADVTASLSAIRAILSPESRETRAELMKEARIVNEEQTNAMDPIDAEDGVGIDDDEEVRLALSIHATDSYRCAA